MRKLSYLFAILAVGLWISSACAGEIAVSGPLTGLWPAGTVVHVTGPSYVPSGKSLTVEEGASIYFDTPDSLLVLGDLTMTGTEHNPITLSVPNNWWGMYFVADGFSIRSLQWVNTDVQGGLPCQVVTGIDAQVSIEHCQFKAMFSCIRWTGGRIWASSNTLATTKLYSCPVTLRHLINDIAGACDNPMGNRVSENLITVDVSRTELPRPTDEFTAGLWIDGSSRVCLYGNAITVDAPGTVIGAYFGEIPTYNGQSWEMPFCVVTVTSFRGSAKGVFKANEGTLLLKRCTLDIAREPFDSPLVPSGVLASHEASVTVNSCYVQLDVGGYFFVGLSGGQLAVDHLVAWRSSEVGGGTNHLPESGVVGDVWLGGHVTYADPQFALRGVRGKWVTLQDVYDYYALRSNSPCIDTGDPDIGNDPDNTPPDIGRYFYDQGDAVTPPPGVLPNAISLSAPYPNPFNAVAVIPFELGRAADVRLTVLDIMGRQVQTLAAGRYEVGKHTVSFMGENLASGTYFVALRANGEAVGIRPITLLK